MTLSRLWFWLTTSTRCSWCKRILHRRWVWLPKRKLECGAVVPHYTDTICPVCFQKFIGPLKLKT